jgi:hypothetical protein
MSCVLLKRPVSHAGFYEKPCRGLKPQLLLLLLLLLQLL